LNNLLNII